MKKVFAHSLYFFLMLIIHSHAYAGETFVISSIGKPQTLNISFNGGPVGWTSSTNPGWTSTTGEAIDVLSTSPINCGGITTHQLRIPVGPVSADTNGGFVALAEIISAAKNQSVLEARSLAMLNVLKIYPSPTTYVVESTGFCVINDYYIHL